MTNKLPTKRYYNLQGYFFSHHIRLEDVAVVLGIVRTSLYLRLNGKVPFKRSEIEKLKEVYKLNDFYFK